MGLYRYRASALTDFGFGNASQGSTTSSKFEQVAQARYEELLFERSGLISYDIGRKAKNFGAMTVEELAKRYLDRASQRTLKRMAINPIST